MANLRDRGSFRPRSFTTRGEAVVSERPRAAKGGQRVPVEWTTFAALRMRNGKIARAQALPQRAEALEAVGLSE